MQGAASVQIITPATIATIEIVEIVKDFAFRNFAL
jgi:hypothetical protein